MHVLRLLRAPSCEPDPTTSATLPCRWSLKLWRGAGRARGLRAIGLGFYRCCLAHSISCNQMLAGACTRVPPSPRRTGSAAQQVPWTQEEVERVAAR